MDTLIKIAQVILALSILILVHEFGHFFFARLFKIRVEKFYLFFNPWFTPFKFKSKKSGTEYGIGWLPLGGYCKIAGMVDESLDTEALSKEPQPWEFRSRPTWQRFLVLFGGVFFNFILAILVYSGILFTWGDDYLKNEDAIYGVHCNQLALDIGFKHGDRILSFDNVSVERFNDLQITLARNQAESAQLIRDGEKIEITIDPSFLPDVLNTPGMFGLGFPFQVSQIDSLSPNLGILELGDRFLTIDTLAIKTAQEVTPLLSQLKGRGVTVTILRNDSVIEERVEVNQDGMLGIILEGDINKFFKITTINYTLGESVVAGANKSVVAVGNYVKELGLIFSPKTKAYKSVGSFITIGKIFPSTWDWYIFWTITAVLSIMLAVINLLPIPALDGGHILFVLYEMVVGKKPSDRFLEVAQVIGLLILFMIMFLAFGNDIYRLFK